MSKHGGRGFTARMSVAVLVTVAGLATAGVASGGVTQWPSAGANLSNTRDAADSRIRAANVDRLSVKWRFATEGDVSATPAVDEDAVYVPDWGGLLHKLDKKTGEVIWQVSVQSLVGAAGPVVSRTTPVLAGKLVIFGTQGSTFFGGEPYIVAVSRSKGTLVWKTRIDPTPFAIVTQSPIVYDGKVFVGVASAEEGVAGFLPYACCLFRGSMSALDLETGAIAWTTYTVPDEPGYSGGGVWSSTAAIDPARDSVYITTGNNYSVPQSVEDCVALVLADTTLSEAEKAQMSEDCLDPADYIDSVMSLDIDSGAIRWANRLEGYDAWNVSCFGFFGDPNQCPDPTGPDYDFGQGALLYTATIGGQPRDLVGAGQKSGRFWSLDRDTGAVVWGTQVGPGGTLGGLEWGSATDGTRIYAAVANNAHTPYTTFGSPTPNNADGGSWAALDAATGGFIWQIPDPNLGTDGRTAIDLAPVSVANDVVFGCSMDAAGHMYAFNAATGATLWRFASGGSCNGGPAITGNTVFWGTGYGRFGLGTGYAPPAPRTGFTGLYAFSL